MMLRQEDILIQSILTDRNRLPLVEKTVAALVSSIGQIGLVNPIIVFRSGGNMPTLVAGRHRLEACKRLKMKTVVCRVLNTDDAEVRAWAALAEIDENLIRRDLTAAQRARLISQRKAAYEAAHPETKNGGAGRGRAKLGQVGQAIERFTADTAAKTGKPERTIRRDATRAKALGSDLDRVTGTSLDKGAELDALAAMPAEQRAPIIQRAVSGEAVSAIRPTAAQEPKPGYAELARSWKAFRTAWLKSSPVGRSAFLNDTSADLEAIFGGSKQASSNIPDLVATRERLH